MMGSTHDHDVGMTCDHCGKSFRGNPKSQPLNGTYCSISCEEGRAPLPEEDPASPGFPAYIRQNPESLVGYTVVVEGIKRTCYAPDWHRDPSDYSRRSIIENDEENEILVYKTSTVLGDVTAYNLGDDTFTVEYESPDADEEDRTHRVPAEVVRRKLSDYFHSRDAQGCWIPKDGAWWAE